MQPAIVRRLNAEFARVARDPDIQKVYENIGADPVGGTPEEFRSMMASEIAKLAPMVRASGARID